MVPPSPPVISVVMGVYNAEQFLTEAIDSILTQTFHDFEFIIVNDGSTDATAAILDRYNDPRLRILHNARNNGLSLALNRGLDVAHGKYVARMDADDIANPQRLMQQLDFMEQHPDAGCVGVEYEVIDASGQVVGISQDDGLFWQQTSDFLRWRLLWKPPVAHSGWMLHYDLLQQHQLRYNPDYLTTQDYEFLCRICEYTNPGIVPAVLLKYRQHPAATSTRYKVEQLSYHYAVSKQQIQNLIGTVDERCFDTLFSMQIARESPATATRHIVGAIRLLRWAYREFLNQHQPTTRGQQQIQQDMLNQIGSMASGAGRTGYFYAALYGWMMWLRLATWKQRGYLLTRLLQQMLVYTGLKRYDVQQS